MARWCAVLTICALMALGAEAARRERLPDLPPAQQAEVDDMVNNLLHWIQGLYSTQKSRKARQYYGGKPEKPRPFEPATYLPPAPPTGYPASGSRPTPAYSEGTRPPYQPSQPSTPDQLPYQPPYNPSSPSQPSPPTLPPYQPSQPNRPSYQPPSQPTYQPPSQPTYQPSQPTYQPPSQPTYQPSQPTYQPSSQPSYPTQPDYQPSQPSQPPYQPSPTSPKPSEPVYKPTQPQQYQPSQPTPPPYKPSQPNPSQPTQPTEPNPDDDDRHPPHIHAITVDCGKEMMTINIEFNKPYNGIIYSQDHYNEPDCVYVQEGSNQVKFSFTVSLNSCGTQFISDFQNAGQAYLENVLVLQNEPGIQEVWDHIRRVRCLWEGNLNQQLVSSLSVGMLNQITSNFSGDTAMARLDIQVGRGPFAEEAQGLVKIGETMTLVVSVMGDPGFDIHVRECVARDAESKHIVPLTDSNGCVLKTKLFGAFQKTRDTGNSGASIIAFAYFNAFKFPDEMDLIIQCDVELCKTDCEMCPNPGSIEPRKRRRRDIIHVGNQTMDLEPVTTIGKGFRVVLPEELPPAQGICVSPMAALWGGVFVVMVALTSSAIASYCWQRSRNSTKS